MWFSCPLLYYDHRPDQDRTFPSARFSRGPSQSASPRPAAPAQPPFSDCCHYGAPACLELRVNGLRLRADGPLPLCERVAASERQSQQWSTEHAGSHFSWGHSWADCSRQQPWLPQAGTADGPLGLSARASESPSRAPCTRGCRRVPGPSGIIRS